MIMSQATNVNSTPSAIARAHNSGLELVPQRKRKGKRATIRDYAKIDFNPWPREKNGKLAPSAEAMQRFGVSGRIAHAVMLMTREDMITNHGKLDHKIMDQMMGDLANTAECLKEITLMIETAYQRLLASACAADKRGIKFKGV
jgi:hypothetical protein